MSPAAAKRLADLEQVFAAGLVTEAEMRAKRDAILADAAPAPAGAAPPPADEAADAPPPPPPADDLAAKLQKRAEAIAEIRARARQNTAAARERAEAAKREDAPAAEEGA